MVLFALSGSANGQTLPGTKPLSRTGDLGLEMVESIDRYLEQALANSPAARQKARPTRAQLSAAVGIVDARLPFDTAGLVSTLRVPALVATSTSFRAVSVRWPVIPGVTAEGLLLTPRRAAIARVVAIPDADVTPEQFTGLALGLSETAQLARRLAENGIEVLIPALIDRKDTFSGTKGIGFTNMPHREWLHRQLFPVGRHLIGIEVQKVLAGVEWSASILPRLPVGVMGYGEGGILALVAAALDERIVSTMVSGAFEPRERVWQQPIYRSVWGQLEGLGDAQVAGLVAPRTLVVEASSHPKVDGPPPPGQEKDRPRRGAAPGRIETPPLDAVQREFEMARKLYADRKAEGKITLVPSAEGQGEPGTKEALQAFLAGLGITAPVSAPFLAPKDERPSFEPAERQRQQVEELVAFAQRLVHDAGQARKEFWKNADLTSVANAQKTSAIYRQRLWSDLIGRLPAPSAPLSAESRVVYDRPAFTGYEVLLPVWPNVFAYGVLLVPKDLKDGERRPVVVTQHGLNGRPQDLVEARDPRAKETYQEFAARLAERGFVVFAPQNPYIGDERFRVLLRKAQPLKLSLFSFIVGQHERTLDWLAALPFVDPQRIGFYGFSYGGKTAMRVPPLLDRYAVVICSGDFNEWLWKVTSVSEPVSYMFTPEYDMLEWNLGNTFNYAEMASLILPRPFMVERGHRDPVGLDEWVGYEYAKVRRLYDELGIGDRTAIEFFNGGHKIHGQGSFDFLHRHLNWPKR